MKITYAGPTGDPVRSIDASAVRRAVKITLKNLKRWCVRLRRGTTKNRVGFKGDRQNCPDESKVLQDGTPTMIVDQEESRNRANENLENELRESLGERTTTEPTRKKRTVSSATMTAHRRPSDDQPVASDEPVARTDIGIAVPRDATDDTKVAFNSP